MRASLTKAQQEPGRHVLAAVVGGTSLLAGEFVWNMLARGQDVSESIRGFGRWSPTTTLIVLTLNTFLVGAIGVALATKWSTVTTRSSALLQASGTVWFLAFFHCALVTTALGVEPAAQFLWSAAWGLVEIPVAIGLGLLIAGSQSAVTCPGPS